MPYTSGALPHRTGHGIGYYLCVHEGPQSIRYQYNPQPLLPGMVTSNEPGLYREGMHGIRHENIVLCKEAGTSEFGDWLETLAPHLPAEVAAWLRSKTMPL